MNDDGRTDAARAPKRVRTELDATRSAPAEEPQSQEPEESAGAEYWAALAGDAEAQAPVRRDLYLDSINRQLLDFDFEKLCSVSLSNVHIYACLVCGKYFQGRGKKTHAYFHSIDEGHHVYMNLDTARVYILPDNYEAEDASLADIQYQLSLTFTEDQIAQLDAPDAPLARDLHAKPYRPGFVGLNNISQNDSMNVVIQALAHVPPLRNYFLRGGVPMNLRKAPPRGHTPTVAEAAGQLVHSTELVQRFSMLLRRMWNPHAFKGQVSPHEFLQEVGKASQGRFTLTEQCDPVEFLGWLLNRLHFDLAGGASAARKRATIITLCFQGEVRVESQHVIMRTGLEGEEVDRLDHDGRRSGGQQDDQGHAKFNPDKRRCLTNPAIHVTTSPFLLLALDLPRPPVFQDVVAENIIPQIPIAHVLAKYDGAAFQEAQGMIRRYHLTKLPPYLLFHFRRFTKNRFVEERNPTIINFPTEGLDMCECTSGDSPDIQPTSDASQNTVYSLLSNITHEATPGTVRENSVWRSQVHTRLDGATGQAPSSDMDEHWFQMQDLLTEDINKEMLFLGETYLQVWEQAGAAAVVNAQAERLVLPRQKHALSKKV